MEGEDIRMSGNIEATRVGTVVVAPAKQWAQLVGARHTFTPGIEALHYLRLWLERI